MIDINKMRHFVASFSDAELIDAVNHLDDETFSDDNIVRRIFNEGYDDDNRFILYLTSITKVLCEESIKRLKIYSPHIDK